ncbi:hypothetical protein, partial [Duganella sp. Root198D2]|uniref:hypothetical protein n=1 Tax=Duganella sp. Root198D2 TaxID=1736489 RepID=UPI001E33C1B7
NCAHFSETLQISAALFAHFTFRFRRRLIVQGRLKENQVVNKERFGMARTRPAQTGSTTA